MNEQGTPARGHEIIRKARELIATAELQGIPRPENQGRWLADAMGMGNLDGYSRGDYLELAGQIAAAIREVNAQADHIMDRARQIMAAHKAEADRLAGGLGPVLSLLWALVQKYGAVTKREAWWGYRLANRETLDIEADDLGEVDAEFIRLKAELDKARARAHIKNTGEVPRGLTAKRGSRVVISRVAETAAEAGEVDDESSAIAG